MFIDDLSINIRNWKQPKCPSIGKWLNHGISTSGNTNQRLNKTKMKTERHCAEWKIEPVKKKKKKHILYDSSVLKMTKPYRQKTD